MNSRCGRTALAATAATIVLVVATAGPAQALVANSGWWIRGSISLTTVCGLAEVGNLYGAYSGKGTTARVNGVSTCFGSLAPTETAVVTVFFQKFVGGTWTNCAFGGTGPVTSSYLEKTVINLGACGTSHGTWRTLTTHGGNIGAVYFSEDHFPLSVQAAF